MVFFESATNTKISVVIMKPNTVTCGAPIRPLPLLLKPICDPFKAMLITGAEKRL